MKKFCICALLSLFFSSVSNAAPEPPKTYPLCIEGARQLPCQHSDEDANLEVTDMFFDNRKGFSEISAKAPGIKKGLTSGFLMRESRVIMLKQTKRPSGMGHPSTITETTMQYELLLDDCRGTDACLGTFLWTATGVTTSDGYSYETKYTNTITPVDYGRFPKPSMESAK